MRAAASGLSRNGAATPWLGEVAWSVATGCPNSGHASLRHSYPCSGPASAVLAGCPQSRHSGGVTLPTLRRPGRLIGTRGRVRAGCEPQAQGAQPSHSMIFPATSWIGPWLTTERSSMPTPTDSPSHCAATCRSSRRPVVGSDCNRRDLPQWHLGTPSTSCASRMSRSSPRSRPRRRVGEGACGYRANQFTVECFDVAERGRQLGSGHGSGPQESLPEVASLFAEELGLSHRSRRPRPRRRCRRRGRGR